MGEWSLALRLGCGLWRRRGVRIRERLGDQRVDRKGCLSGSRAKRRGTEMPGDSRSEQQGNGRLSCSHAEGHATPRLSLRMERR